MKKLVFICPYFGELPKTQMELWLQTCKYNPSIDWMVYTNDEEPFDYPSNVKVKICTLNQIKDRIQSKFDFPISLERPYKLCDYKPAYGFIFEEDIQEYDYWGHCDLSDSLFGNLRLFLTDEVLSKADKTLFWGHMSIYRNTECVNRRFMLKANSPITYKEVFQNPENMCFDEVHAYSIDAIYKYNGFAFTRIDEMYHDIKPLYYWFRTSRIDENYIAEAPDKCYRVYRWKKGILSELRVDDNAICEKELGYIHYQKRRMKKRFNGEAEDFIISPDGYWLTKDIKLSVDWIRKHDKHKVFYKMYYIQRWRNLKYKVKHIGQLYSLCF